MFLVSLELIKEDRIRKIGTGNHNIMAMLRVRIVRLIRLITLISIIKTTNIARVIKLISIIQLIKIIKYYKNHRQYNVLFPQILTITNFSYNLIK